MAGQHSLWPASSFARAIDCPGAYALVQRAALGMDDGLNLEDRPSYFAAEGTAAHYVMEQELLREGAAAEWLGRTLRVSEEGVAEAEDQKLPPRDVFNVPVDADMVQHAQAGAAYIRLLAADGGSYLPETRVHYPEALGLVPGVEDAWGTADAVVFRAGGKELVVFDLKYGRGVDVSPERNPQLLMYALGAVEAYDGLAGDFERVRMVIFQPRVRQEPKEWDCSMEELREWRDTVARPTARSVLTARSTFRSLDDKEWADTFLNPTEDACRWCPLQAVCPAARGAVTEAVFGSSPATVEEFEDLTAPQAVDALSPEWLAAALGKIGLIEDWCKAIRARAEATLLGGDDVPGYKLVRGRAGNRRWANVGEAEALLKSMRLKVEEMYDLKLISPTTAEKLAKAGTIGPRQWKRVEPMVERPEGSLTVAPCSDPRAQVTVTPVEDEFNDETEAPV